MISRSFSVSALALVAACGGKKGVSAEQCAERAATIEARLHAQAAELDQLEAIRAIVGEPTETIPAVEEGSTDFAAGIVLPITSATPSVLEEVANAEACAAQTTKRPIRIYAVSTDDPEITEDAVWLRRAGKTWGVSFDLRRLVHLARQREVFPWPPNSANERAMARKAFAGPVEPYMDELDAARKRVTKGCDAINEIEIDLIKQHANHQLALPQGLRTCGCSVANVDELESVWHALFFTETDIGWIPPPDDGKTLRSVSPLACENASDAILVGGQEAWTATSADMRTVKMGVLAEITKCRDSTKLDHSAIVTVKLMAADSATTIRTEIVNSPLRELQQCYLNALATFPVAQPSQGSATVLVYLPPAKLTPAP